MIILCKLWSRHRISTTHQKKEYSSLSVIMGRIHSRAVKQRQALVKTVQRTSCSKPWKTRPQFQGRGVPRVTCLVFCLPAIWQIAGNEAGLNIFSLDMSVLNRSISLGCCKLFSVLNFFPLSFQNEVDDFNTC